MNNVRIRFKYPDNPIRYVRGRDLVPNPNNWQTHPPEQAAALAGVFEEIGYADVLKVYELPDGRYGLIDGHLRADLLSDEDIPVLVTDLDEVEARKLLATFDRVGKLAGVDEAALARLLEGMSFESEAVNRMLAEASATTTAATTAGEGEGNSSSAEPAEERWGLLIDCADEAEQVRAIEHLQQGGFTRFRTLVG